MKSGAWAITEEGKPLGFIAPNGILFLSSIEPLNSIKVGECTISRSSFEDINDLQEVFCE